MADELTDEERSLMERIGCELSDVGLFRQAITHRSYANEYEGYEGGDNERLEFLGDAVLDLVVSEMLMERFIDAQEGELSRMRAALVSEAGLAKKAEEMGVGPALRLGRGEALSGGREKPSLLSDAFEALIAAVYTEHGFEKVRDLAWRIFGPVLDEGLGARDPKTELQKHLQANGRRPEYRLVEARGPDHAKEFEVEMCVDGQVWGTGVGRSKKEAERNAAAEGLKSLSAHAD